MILVIEKNQPIGYGYVVDSINLDYTSAFYILKGVRMKKTLYIDIIPDLYEYIKSGKEYGTNGALNKTNFNNYLYHSNLTKMSVDYADNFIDELHIKKEYIERVVVLNKNNQIPECLNWCFLDKNKVESSVKDIVYNHNKKMQIKNLKHIYDILNFIILANNYDKYSKCLFVKLAKRKLINNRHLRHFTLNNYFKYFYPILGIGTIARCLDKNEVSRLIIEGMNPDNYL